MGALVSLVGGMLTDVIGEKLKATLTGKEVAVNPGKSLVQSKTMWGVFIATFGPTVAGWIGFTPAEFVDLVDGIIIVFGVLLAWYGRKKADTGRSIGSSS